MAQELPPLNASIYEAVEALKTDPKIAQALQLALDETDFAMQEQIEICEIPSPTFQESTRAQEIANRMKKYGLTDVCIDEIGNVVGKLKGHGNGPIVAFGAHMDIVFPMDTPINVTHEGNIYRAPGIGDNASGLRALLQTIRCFMKFDIQPEGDIYFVGTVGEEGNGDIRGSKFFNSHNHVDAFIAVDGTDVHRILHAAIGSHRWRLSIDGEGGHSMSGFGTTPSAIHAMCIAGAKVAKLKTNKASRTTFTIGTIKGGRSVNTIAPHCECDIDMRSLDNNDLLDIEARILKCFDDAVEEENSYWDVDRESKILKVTKTQIGDRPAGQLAHECPLLQVARSAQKALGIELKNYGFSSTDANYPVSVGIPATCLCAGGQQVDNHTTAEYYVKEDIHLGPQLVFLTAIALAGFEQFKPLLPKRS